MAKDAVVGGWAYVQVDGEYVGRSIRRLLPSGDPDPTFDLMAEVGPGTTDGAMHLQPDGRILSGMTTLNRVLAVATVDTGFSPVTGGAAWDPWFETVVAQDNGKVIVGGRFASLNGETHSRIARLLPDGQLDDPFATGVGEGFHDPGSDCSTEVAGLALQPDERVLAHGFFSTYDGQPVK